MRLIARFCWVAALFCLGLTAHAQTLAQGPGQVEPFAVTLKRAQAGNASAQYQVYRRYGMGDGVATNPREAGAWLKVSAQNGYAPAQYTLGNAYLLYQSPGDPDFVQAVKWWKLAAAQGHIDAQYWLAGACMAGNGVPKDEREALKWYLSAAEKGQGAAQEMVGLCYYNGVGVVKNLASAAQWLRQGAGKGISPELAHITLGDMCYFGMGIEKNPTEAYQHYLAAGQKGDSYAQFAVARCLQTGNGVAEDPKAAAEWLSRAAQQGEVVAEKYLGIAYHEGIGVAKDDAVYYKWMLVAAILSQEDAAHFIAPAQYMLSKETMAEGEQRAREFLRLYKEKLPPYKKQSQPAEG
jgi:TPR repeat protein